MQNNLYGRKWLVSYYSAKKKQFTMSLKYDFFIYSTIFSGHRNFLSIKQIFINLVGWKAIAERNITGGNIFSKRIKFEKIDLIFFFWSWKFSFYFDLQDVSEDTRGSLRVCKRFVKKGALISACEYDGNVIIILRLMKNIKKKQKFWVAIIFDLFLLSILTNKHFYKRIEQW